MSVDYVSHTRSLRVKCAQHITIKNGDACVLVQLKWRPLQVLLYSFQNGFCLAAGKQPEPRSCTKLDLCFGLQSIRLYTSALL